MGKSGKPAVQSGKPGSFAKEERKARKAELNRSREKSRRHRQQLDSTQLASFGKALLSKGFELSEVARDGNCFFRSLSDQLENHEHNFDTYRQQVCKHLEAHEEEFSPFMSFGESEEEDDKDYAAYVERMRTDGEWAGQVELIAAAQALQVHIVVHQYEHPSYRIECPSDVKGKQAPLEIHVSYHDGEHYNSVHPIARARKSAQGSVVAATSKQAQSAESADGEAAGSTDANSLAADFSAARLDDGSSTDVNADDSGAPSRPSGLVAESDGGGACGKGPDSGAAAATVMTGGGTGSGQSTTVREEASADGRSASSETCAPGASRRTAAQEAKAKRKEEKRVRKEQKHREAVVAARGETREEEADADEAQTPSIITL